MRMLGPGQSQAVEAGMAQGTASLPGQAWTGARRGRRRRSARQARRRPGRAVRRLLLVFLGGLLLVVAVASAFRPRTSRNRPSVARTEHERSPRRARRARPHKASDLRLRPDPGLPRPDPEDLETLARASGIPAGERVFVFRSGRVEVTTRQRAEAQGLSVVDLSDDHVPFLFSERTPGRDDLAPNEYRKTYVAVANDRTDEQGRPLGPDQHNYVELFGINPSLSVLRRRFLEDAAKPCFAHVNLKLLAGFRGVIRYRGVRAGRKVLARYEYLARRVRAALHRTGLRSLARLRRRKAYAGLVREYLRLQVRVAVVAQTQARLACEGFFGQNEHYAKGVFDYVTHRALARFERKHMVFGWGQIYGETLRALGRPPIENDYRALWRTLRERVADSLGIIEDGSVQGVRGLVAVYDDKGEKHPVPNLVRDYTQALVEETGWTSAEAALTFFQKQRPELFRDFKVAVRLPPLPPYYAPVMKFRVVIDRGDVWYDYPYDSNGRPKRQPRSRLPHLTLYTLWNGQAIPLVRYQTTIGGWRKEHKDGKVYLRYKNSDVGPRVWRDIVAAPVWIPPESTPPSALVERRKEGGKWVWRLKREEIGPSYLSAYGLVAAYHLQQIGEGRHVRWRDNGIRTHGSVSYMSIFGGYSHGCHRLHNHLAVRLFSFLLRHSRFRRRGQVPLRYGRTFQYKGRTFTIRLHTRGYYYTLYDPIPVEVTEGRIRGEQKSPIEVYMPVPGEHYDPNDPNLRQPAEGEGWSGADSLPPEVPPPDETPIHPAAAPKDATSLPGSPVQGKPRARPGHKAARPAGRSPTPSRRHGPRVGGGGHSGAGQGGHSAVGGGGPSAPGRGGAAARPRAVPREGGPASRPRPGTVPREGRPASRPRPGTVPREGRPALRPRGRGRRRNPTRASTPSKKPH